MIRKLHIQNYKSLQDLELEVGRFNVLIGENGCGKSNVLEAIALAAAAAADKLDNEFLTSRGIRVTEPQLMRSAFSHDNMKELINIGIGFENVSDTLLYELSDDNEPYPKWTKIGTIIAEIGGLYDYWKKIHGFELTAPKEILPILKEHLFGFASDIVECNEDEVKLLFDRYGYIESSENRIKNFIIYSPENTALRNFNKEGQIEPLGINGEGLLKLLKVILIS